MVGVTVLKTSPFLRTMVFSSSPKLLSVMKVMTINICVIRMGRQLEENISMLGAGGIIHWHWGGTYVFWHLGKPQLQEMWTGARILLPHALSISKSGWAQNRDLQLCMDKGGRYQEGLSQNGFGSIITVRAYCRAQGRLGHTMYSALIWVLGATKIFASSKSIRMRDRGV